MSIIIRLQNLPWSANALDIRQYFHGLSIPEGGVHIVGGELGDAFIAFSTDEDARQAFLKNNGKIKEVQITLMLSSRTEMQRVIEQARNQSFAAFAGAAAPAAVPAPAAAAAAPPPLPAAVPQVVQAAPARAPSPDSDRDGKRKKKKSRSRSKSRERDRSRDRKSSSRRYRDRSRSRDRRDSRRSRRDRSRSRGRSRSRDKTLSRRSGEYQPSSRSRDGGVDRSKELKSRPEVWASPAVEVLAGQQAKGLLGPFPVAPTLVGALQGLQNGLLPARRPAGWSSPQQQQQQPGGRHHQRNNGGGGKYEPIDVDGDEQVDACVMMEPFYGTYGDLRKFFSGLHISFRGIKLINDEDGHRTGIVYIQFITAKAKEEAVARSGRELNGIAVKIQHLADDDFEKAVDRYKPQYEPQEMSYAPRCKNITKYFNNQNGGGPSAPEPEIKDYSCLKVEELPSYAKEQDILHMFSLHPLLSLHLTPRARGGHVAYVKFSSQEVARQALDERQQHVVGGKAVAVRPCADAEFEAISREREVDLEVKAKVESVGTECLQLTKLPQKTNDRDIADFFSDIGLVPTKIHLMSNNLGFTGTAYCEFDNVDEATRASKKDGANIGAASVAVRPVARGDMESVLRSTVPAPQGPPAGAAAAAAVPAAPSFPAAPPPALRFAPPPAAARPPFAPRSGGFGQRGGRGAGPPPPPRLQRFPPSGGGGGGGGGEDAPPGCTVYMDNVPYKAGTNEILEFFDGYNCTNNVSRRYNPNNTPSAEAKVTFFNPDDATRAVQELHGQKIWERSIYLTQV